MSLLWRLYTEPILRLADRRFSNLSPPRSECKESVIHRRTDPGTIFTGSSMYTLHLKYVSCIWSCFCIDHFSSFWNALFHNSEIRERGKVERTDYRYDESWLASNINEALYKSVLTPELLTYIVDDIKIKSVENTEDTTTISVSAKLRRTILENDQHIVVKNEKENWTLSRALHPNRLKSKGQDIVIEKECPSCGANYVPDEKGCCSYCGYSLKVDNSKWKINASEKRNMSTIV